MDYKGWLLSALLDRYEKSAHFFGAGKISRRVSFPFNAKTAPGYWAGDQPLIKEAIHQAVQELAAAGILSVEWLRAERGNLLQRVTLNLAQLEEAYRVAGRAPKADELETLARLLAKAAEASRTGWIQQFLTDCGQELQSKREVPAPLPRERQETELLLKALSGLDDKGDAEMPQRVFSLRYLGSSKQLTGRVRTALVAAARQYKLTDPELPEADVLAELGLVKTTDELLLAGPLTLEVRGRRIDVSPLIFGTVVDAQMERDIDIVELRTETVLLVENKTNFHELARRGVAEKILLVYLGGFPGPRKRCLLGRLRTYGELQNPTTVFHWGDIDLGGLQIYRLLRAEVFPGLQPLFMDEETLLRYQEWGEPLLPAYRSKLARLTKDVRYTNFHCLIALMLQLNIRLEQEALLADVKLQLPMAPLDQGSP
ncbi:MAG: DUF2220 domain-containing protein [Firmicutes bacterium]|nr:DUF2220 domain-containing protein [Bacillota bacterium]